MAIIRSEKTPDLPYEDVDPIKIFTAVKELNKMIKSDTKLLKEAQFVMKTNYAELKGINDNIEVLVQGVIDLAIINKDCAVIIDFKTNKTKNVKFLKEHYGLQLKMYALAFEKRIM